MLYKSTVVKYGFIRAVPLPVREKSFHPVSQNLLTRN